MLNSIPALNRSLDHFSRAAGSALRSAEGLAADPDMTLRTVEPPNANQGSNPTGPQADAPPEPLEIAAAQLSIAKTQVRRAITLVRAENEMIGSLLDIMA